MQEYDRSSKWLIEHYAPAMLRLAGITDVISCRPVPGEVVQPRQLPDGLLEVHIRGVNEPVWFIMEIATYPDRRVSEQVLRDALLVVLDRRQVPEVVTLVLHPKGTYQVPGTQTLTSPLNGTRIDITWRVVELWRLSDAPLLAANEVGLIPWIGLTELTAPPEVVFQECRRRIDQEAPEQERENLLAVTQVLMRLRYNDPKLLAIFGGSRAMIESPLIQEIVSKARCESMHGSVIRVLETRFGAVPAELAVHICSINDEQRLQDIEREAVRSSDLEAFRLHLTK